MRKPCAILTLISMLLAVPVARADDHLVSSGAAQQKLTEAAAERANNLRAVEGVLGSIRASKVASAAGIDLGQVRASLPQLSNADLRDLSHRAAALKVDPAAGHYHDSEDALVFVIVVAAAALVLIAVADRA
jgi:hypothetical protein